MRLFTAALGLLLPLAATGSGQQEVAPLESSKQALKELQSSQATKGGTATTGNLADGLPQIQTPLPGAVSPDQAGAVNPPETRQDLRRKQASRRNWLLDGVSKLERDTETRKRARRDGRMDSTEEEEEMPDSFDSDYLIRIYSERKQEEEDAKSGLRRTITERSDPIAPFLQDWLGNSPVRGKFFDEFVRKADAGKNPDSLHGSAIPGGVQGLDRSADLVDKGRVEIPRNLPNPYLTVPDYSIQATSAVGGDLNRSKGAATTLEPAASIPTIPALIPNPLLPPPAKTSPLRIPADNEKYFPQLKKF